MNMTIVTLRQHKKHVALAMQHISEMLNAENMPQSAMRDFAIENHDEMLRWELERANEAVVFCRSLKAAEPLKQQHVFRIASNRLIKLAKHVQGVRLP